MVCSSCRDLQRIHGLYCGAHKERQHPSTCERELAGTIIGLVIVASKPSPGRGGGRGMAGFICTSRDRILLVTKSRTFRALACLFPPRDRAFGPVIVIATSEEKAPLEPHVVTHEP